MRFLETHLQTLTQADQRTEERDRRVFERTKPPISKLQ